MYRRTNFREELLTKPTKEFAYILGLLWADGHMKKSGSRIDMEIIFKDGKSIQSNFKKTGDWNFSSRKRKNRQKTMLFYNGTKGLIDFLRENDYHIKKDCEPNKILNFLGEHLKKYWLLGLIDGDGNLKCCKQTLAKRRGENWLSFALTIYSNINQKWKWLENICKSLNINFSIKLRIRNSGEGSEFKLTGPNAAIFCKEIYKTIKIPHFSRKEKHFIKYHSYIKKSKHLYNNI